MTTHGVEKKMAAANYIDNFELGIKPGTDDSEQPTRDIYALAYLCGGTCGVLTLYLFELVQQGYLEIVEFKKWYGVELRMRVAQNTPPRTELTGISNELLGWFSEPQSPGDTYQRIFPNELRLHCWNYRESLLERGLLRGWFLPERGNNFWKWGLGVSAASSLIIGILTSQPHISDFTTVFVIGIWLGISLFLCEVIYRIIVIRLSSKGKGYIQSLKNNYEHLRVKQISAKTDSINPSHRVALAIFGVSSLAHDTFYKFLQPLETEKAREYGMENGAAYEGGGE